MLLLNGYASKAMLKASIGEPLKYEETSIFGPEYKPNGVIFGAKRQGREFYAQITMANGLIQKVE